MYSCYLFFVSSASVRSLPPLSFYCVHLCINAPLAPIFLKRTLVFPLQLLFLYFSALFSWEGLLISLCYSLELHSVEYIFPFLPCLSLLFLPQLFCKASSDNYSAFLRFFFFGTVLVAASRTLQTSVHSSSDTPSTRSSPLNLFVTSPV